MEPTSENLKSTENAFKNMYSKLHNVPREDIEDIPVEELTNLESSLINRANKTRFKEIKAVNSGNLKKEDLGKDKKDESNSEKILTPEAEQVASDVTENKNTVPDISKKENKVDSKNTIPDITDLDKKLKSETAFLPEPPNPSKTENEKLILNDLKSEKGEPTKNIQINNTVTEVTKPASIEPVKKETDKKINTPIEQDSMPMVKSESELSIDQEQKLRSEYPFVDFDKKPADESEAKWLNQFKKDLLTKINERESINTPQIPQNITIEKEQEEKLRTEYPFFDFDKKPADESEAKWLNQFKSDLLSTLKEKEKNTTPTPLATEQTTSSNANISNNPTANLPEPMAATIDSLKDVNMGNLNEMIDQMTAIAMGYQKNSPIEERVSSTSSATETSLKSIDQNINNLNKLNTVSTKELKVSIDSLRKVAEEILAYLPNIQSTNILANNNQQQRDIQPLNTGLLQRYKNEVRQQYGADIIDLSNNRPTMPGFTI